MSAQTQNGYLDLHSVYDATGSTDTVVVENNANAVIPANDGATNIGLSPYTGSILCAFGAHVDAAAQALTTIGLSGNNLFDPTNKLLESYNSTPAITSAIKGYFLQLNYLKGQNLVNYANEAAGKTATYKIDYVRGIGGQGSVFGSGAPINPGIYTQVLGASTAGVYSSTALSPTNQTPPVGKYAILGAKATALTTAAVLRFQHSDFGGAYPGFPVLDYATGTLTSANQGGNEITSDSWQGSQFVKLGTLLGVPCCPVFRIQGQGTGLNIQCLDTNADTPQVVVYLQQISNTI